MEKDHVSKLISELTAALPGFVPLGYPDSGDAEQRFALANAYKDKGFRDYLIKSIRHNLEGFQRVEGERGLYTQQGRLEILKELFGICKKTYLESEKLSKSLEDKLAEK